MSKYLSLSLAGGCILGCLALLAPPGSTGEKSPRAKKGAAAKPNKKPPITHRVMESYPQAFQAYMENQERFQKKLPSTLGGNRITYVIYRATLWPQNATVRVAFLGGDAALHKDIAQATEDWTKQCNIKLDFGFNPSTGEYRKWTTADTTYAAEIRISFDQPGFWSWPGTWCIRPEATPPSDPAGGRPNQRSMNFAGFAGPNRDVYWRSVVLHEFGHALGFMHEHQHPTQGCEDELRWDDDPGYVPTTNQFGGYVADSTGRRPGIYTVFAGYPNYWDKAKVDGNMRQWKDSHAFFELSDFDKNSIMKYYYEPWMFKQGEASRCYSLLNTQLSGRDIDGVQKMYPKNGLAQSRLAKQQRTFLKELTQIKTLPPATIKHYQLQLKKIKEK